MAGNLERDVGRDRPLGAEKHRHLENRLESGMLSAALCSQSSCVKNASLMLSSRRRKI